MVKKSTYGSAIVIILLLVGGVVLCFEIVRHTGQSNNPLTLVSNTVVPTRTVLFQPTQFRTTQTPTILLSITDVPTTCPPFGLQTELHEPDMAENYIGCVFSSDDLPLGLIYMGGRTVRDEYQQYELGINEFLWYENRLLFLLTRRICSDENGIICFEVVDAFASPPTTGNESAPWKCFRDETEVKFSGGRGGYDENVPIQTIGGYEGIPYSEILFLYYVDLATQQFILIDAEGLICIEGGGPGPDF